LFDLDTDVGETTNVADQHPAIVNQLSALAEKQRDELGDLRRKGAGIRPAGKIGAAFPDPVQGKSRL
jgi:hypothetical protein